MLTQVIIIVALILFLILLFFIALKQHNNLTAKIESSIFKEARNRGLIVKELTIPSISDWNSCPFMNEIKIGTFGFEGIPYKREYVRIVKSKSSLTQDMKVFWIKAIKNKNKTLTLEWQEQSQ